VRNEESPAESGMQGTCDGCGTNWTTNEFVCCPTCQIITRKSYESVVIEENGVSKRYEVPSLNKKLVDRVKQTRSLDEASLYISDLIAIVCEQRQALEEIEFESCKKGYRKINTWNKSSKALRDTDERLKKLGVEV
jgi:hypothetical protein